MSDNTEVKFVNEYYQTGNSNYSQLIQNIYKVDTNEIGPTTQDINENIFEEDLSGVVDELVNFYFEEVNKGKVRRVKKQFVLDYLNNRNINPEEIYNWLLNNQTSS